MTGVQERADARWRHEAVPYAGREEFVPTCAQLVRDGLGEDERMIVLAPQDKIDDLHDELGSDAEDVALVATDRHARNPARVAAMLESFQAAGDGRHSTGVNETVLLGRSPAAQAEVEFTDQLFNNPSLQSWPLSIVCLFDTADLDDLLLRSMRRSHATVRGQADNPDYAPDYGASLWASLPDPAPADAHRLAVLPGGLTELRAFIRRVTSRTGLGSDRVDDLVLAANEIVTNSLRHGGGRADLALWSDDGSVVCEVRDRGVIADPLAGRFAPPPSATSGRGLWLVNTICDLVQIRSSQAGTVVRMYVEH